jgi:hypothetical protein
VSSGEASGLGEAWAFLGVGYAKVEEDRARVNSKGDVGIFISNMYTRYAERASKQKQNGMKDV